MCWPILCLCRPFCTFQRCLDSNLESSVDRHQYSITARMKVALPEEVGKPGAQQDDSLGTEAQFKFIIHPWNILLNVNIQYTYFTKVGIDIGKYLDDMRPRLFLSVLSNHTQSCLEDI